MCVCLYIYIYTISFIAYHEIALQIRVGAPPRECFHRAVVGAIRLAHLYTRTYDGCQKETSSFMATR